MKNPKRKPKFRVGQVVRSRNGYFKVVGIQFSCGDPTVWSYREIWTWWDEKELGPLNKRERGQ